MNFVSILFPFELGQNLHCFSSEQIDVSFFAQHFHQLFEITHLRKKIHMVLDLVHLFLLLFLRVVSILWGSCFFQSLTNNIHIAVSHGAKFAIERNYEPVSFMVLLGPLIVIKLVIKYLTFDQLNQVDSFLD